MMMKVTFYENGQKLTFDMDAKEYLEIIRKMTLGEEVDPKMYVGNEEVVAKILQTSAINGNKKSKSDIEYEACEYDTQL